MSIALKYWAFQQTGWGHVDEGSIPVTPPEPPIITVPGRFDSDGNPFAARYPVVVKRPPLELFDEGFPQNLKLFDGVLHKGQGQDSPYNALRLFDYLTSTAALVEKIAAIFNFNDCLVKETAEVFLRSIATLGTLQVTDSNSYWLSAYQENAISVFHDIREGFEATLPILEKMFVWDQTKDRIISSQLLKEVFRPFVDQVEILEELEDENEVILEAALPTIIARFLEQLETDEED